MNPHARCGYHDKNNPFLKFNDSLVLGNPSDFRYESRFEFFSKKPNVN